MTGERMRRRASALAGIALAVATTSGCGLAAGPAESAPPSATSAPAPTPTPVPPPKTRVTAIGDSIVAGYGLDVGQAWPALVAADRGVAMVNLGCPSAGFVAVGYCGTDFAGLADRAVASAPDVVLIQSSRNDQGRSDAVLRQATAATVAALHARLPTARIVGVSTVWNDRPDPPREVAVSSDALRAAVEAVGGVYVDAGQPLRGRPELMQADDVHPTAEGQRAIADAIAAVLPPLASGGEATATRAG